MEMVGSVLARVLLLRIIPTFFRNLELVFADGVQKPAGEKAKSLQAAGDGKVILANGEASKTVELASIQQILKPKLVVAPRWIIEGWKTTPMTTASISRPLRGMADGDIPRKASNGEVAKPLSGVADYALDAEMGLRYKVTEWASLSLKAEKDIITGSDEADQNKTRYTAGFGVTW
ncbi:hypothetical protein EMIT0P253_150031 [Pseudomonas sp. IT-P253]|jgi:hypothetical protein